MKTALLVLLLLAHTQTAFSAANGPARLQPLSKQDDMSCKIEGFAAGLLAQRRDGGMDKQESMAAVAAELEKFDASDAIGRQAAAHAKGRLEADADLVYGLTDHEPKTLMYLTGYLCAIAKAGSTDSRDGNALIRQAHACQKEYPLEEDARKLDVRDPQTVKLQSCIREAAIALPGGR